MRRDRGDPRYQQGPFRAEALSQRWSEDAVNAEGGSERCRRRRKGLRVRGRFSPSLPKDQPRPHLGLAP